METLVFAAFTCTSSPVRSFFAHKTFGQSFTLQAAGTGRAQIRRSIALNRQRVR